MQGAGHRPGRNIWSLAGFTLATAACSASAPVSLPRFLLFRMTTSSSVPSSSADDSDSRLVRAAQRVASLARRLTRGVAVLTGTSAGAGLLLWGVLWWPPSTNVLGVVGAGATLVVLMGPAAVLALFYQGLRDLQALPERLAERAARTAEQSAEAVRSTTTGASGGFLGRLWGIGKQIWVLRTVLTENRALLLRYGALFRFVTPGFLLLVVGAVGMSLLLVPAAAIAGLVALLLW